jgi:RHS repeat-associated protein
VDDHTVRGAGGRQYGTSEKDKQTLTGENNTSTARLGTVEECSFKLAGSSEFARIDNNGNTLTEVNSSGTTRFTWDFENRLTSVTLPGTGGTVSFKYDPFGRRIYKSSSAGTSIFAYDQGNVVEEVNATGAVVARYADTPHIDDPLAMLRSSTTSYYETDGLGTVTSLSNATGALAQTYTLDSFGNQTASSGSLTNPFKFTGRDFDTGTSLYYYRARYYDPKPGRFLSEDPLGFGQGVNFYAYVANNPVNFVDPTGLAKCCPTKEQDDIQKGADNARRRLDQLRDFGTAVLPTDTAANIGAMTGCTSRSAILPNGQRVPLGTDYPIQINVDPKKHPCDYDCTLKHEQVHQRMCNALGATKFGALSERQIETPAYMVELGCYLNLQINNKLGPYK